MPHQTGGVAHAGHVAPACGNREVVEIGAHENYAGGRRRSFDGLIDQFLPNKYDPPAFALRLAHKDVTLATQLGRELKVPMHMANLALDELTEAMNRGWENRDSRVAMLLQQERAGVKIAVPEAELKAAIERDGKV